MSLNDFLLMLFLKVCHSSTSPPPSVFKRWGGGGGDFSKMAIMRGCEILTRNEGKAVNGELGL